jgi:glyoxylase-like metal-dependent hydrolase (beta-lactamase superfamily II)
MQVHHLNCGVLHAPPYPQAACHCLLLEESGRFALIDTGIGLLDVLNPRERIGQPLIDLAGFQFRESDTAVRQIEQRGFRAADVKHIVLTHLDPDHTGGLADFPSAQVHVSVEELASFVRGHSRYLPAHFVHEPRWQPVLRASKQWFGLEARPLELEISSEVFLIPLFGHTLGHCGVAIQTSTKWLLHVGDAYYLRAELSQNDHHVAQLAAHRADDDTMRRANLSHLQRLAQDHADEIEMVGYHDFSEFPERE